MTTTIDAGTHLMIRGVHYRVHKVSEDKGHLGSKFFGRRLFSLVRVGDGVCFTYFGKRPTGNAKVRLDSSAYTAGDARDGQHHKECDRILIRQSNGDLACPCMVAGYVPPAVRR